MVILILVMSTFLIASGCTTLKSERSVRFDNAYQDQTGTTYFIVNNTGKGAVSHINMTIQWINVNKEFCAETNLDIPLDPALESHTTQAIHGPALVNCGKTANPGYVHINAQYTDNGYYSYYYSREGGVIESASR